jgi:endoglucanase
MYQKIKRKSFKKLSGGWLLGLLVLLLVVSLGLVGLLVSSNARPPGRAASGNPAGAKPAYSTGGPAPAMAAAATPDQLKSIKTQLDASWADYRQRFIQADGRVMDPQQAALTTSEGQSYALLRAVWENDRPTFERVLGWSRNNLQTRGTDKLFSYKWGRSQAGQWQVLDKNSASDADSDIALALIFAAKSWPDQNYRQAGLDILNSIWEKSVVTVKNKPYLTAGDWAPAQERPALNPSYLAPYAYRIFAGFDPAHNWGALVDTSYEVIRGCSEATLAGLGGKNLPPNFCGIDKQTGAFTTAQDYPSLNTSYGYDAFRTYWRVALDYQWYGDQRALDYLKWSSTPRDNYRQNGSLAAEYDHSGKIISPGEDLAVYAGTLGNFMVADPALAQSLVDTKLLPAYRQIQDNDFARAFSGWGDPHNYYNQNWVWFGLALYSDNLPNLAANPAKAR